MSIPSSQTLYQRQSSLQELGQQGQERLLQSSVVIIGCGGLGSIAAVYLAASGVGELHLVDFDQVDVSNLHRQVYYRLEDIGKPKVTVLSQYIRSISPIVKVSSSAVAVSKENVFEIISKGGIVLDCTDVLPIKYLINDACVLSGQTLVYGSLYKFDGYVASFNLNAASGTSSSNLRDAFPEIPTAHIPNCAELGTLNTIVGIIGLMQANEVLKLLTGIGTPLIDELLIYNSTDNSQFRMKLKNQFTKERVKELFEQETYSHETCEVDSNLEITQSEFKDLLNDQKKEWNIISVLENTSIELPFEVDYRVPLSTFNEWILSGYQSDQSYIVVCNRGISSMTATKKMKSVFPEGNVRSLKGGIGAY